MTRSVELTIENVLDGRVAGAAMFREPEVQPVSPVLLGGTTNGSGDDSGAASASTEERNWDELTANDNEEA